MNLSDIAQQFSTENQAREFLEKTLWPNGAVCPHCGVIGESYRLNPQPNGKSHVRPGVWKCGECRKQFTVRVGTIFEDSHIPLHKWLQAIHLLCASKKGMSSHQIHRMLGITYKSAWFMTHRIRHAMKAKPTSQMTGTVEVDETYIGGKLRVGSYAVKPGERPKDRLAGVANTTPVVALVERNGRVRSFAVETVTAKNLKPILAEHIAEEARLNTDENKVYHFARKHFAGHDVVNHARKEYARIEADGRLASTNTVEGFFSLLKRGVNGTFHHLSKHHLHRYLSEFDFRYNARDVSDGERTEQAIQSVVGKRLMYRTRLSSQN
ncbi:MAG: IS1595 family transposase [Terriglobia bacterium]